MISTEPYFWEETIVYLPISEGERLLCDKCDTYITDGRAKLVYLEESVRTLHEEDED